MPHEENGRHILIGEVERSAYDLISSTLERSFSTQTIQIPHDRNVVASSINVLDTSNAGAQ